LRGANHVFFKWGNGRRVQKNTGAALIIYIYQNVTPCAPDAARRLQPPARA
jgi:hypothetical protein